MDSLKKKVFLGKKTLLFFLLRANFPVTLQNLNSYPLISEICGQFLFSSEEFPHSDTDSMEIYCLIWVMGKWPQIQASLQWNNHSKLYIFSVYFFKCAIKWLFLQFCLQIVAEYFSKSL